MMICSKGPRVSIKSRLLLRTQLRIKVKIFASEDLKKALLGAEGDAASSPAGLHHKHAPTVFV